MKPDPALFGLEAELRSEVYHPDGSRNNDALDELEKICCEGIPCIRGEERGVFLGNGGNWYREAAGGRTHQEFSTPECTNPTDAVLYSQAGYHLARRGAEMFSQRHGARTCFSRSNVCFAGQTSWGNHECICTRNPPETLVDALFPHLVSRIIFCGSGGFDAKSETLDFVLSSRVPFIGALKSGSTEGPGRALYHDDYKEERGHGGRFRMHIICGDGLCSERALWLRTATTALIVALADRGRMPGLAAQVAEPLSALHTINADPSLQAAVLCKDGRLRTALDIQRELLSHVARHGEILPLFVQAATTEWRRVIDDLANHGLAGNARSHDNAIKMEMYSSCLALRGVSYGDFSSKARRSRSKSRRAELKRTRAEMLLMDTRFGELSAEGLFEMLDATPGLLDHRVPGVQERIAWALENPPPDTRAAARGAIVRRFHGTPEADQVRVGWSFAVDLASGTKVDLSNPFDPNPPGLGEFVPKPSNPSGKQGGGRNLRDLIGI